MMKLGYARVSTNEQDTAAQVSALKSAGCEKIFFERRHLAGDGTVPNSIACWINYERAMYSLSRVLTDFHVRSEMFWRLLENCRRCGETFQCSSGDGVADIGESWCRAYWSEVGVI